jgi:hypothetical protein
MWGELAGTIIAIETGKYDPSLPVASRCLAHPEKVEHPPVPTNRAAHCSSNGSGGRLR